jgi:CDP-diacylglycerol---glycerol-3-phosphate 3-phosphatidyltransferase
MPPHNVLSNPATSSLHHQRRNLQKLRRRWLWTALIYLAALLLGLAILDQIAHFELTANWILWSSLIMVIELAVLWRILPANHPPDEQRLRPTFGYGTTLTLLCGLLLFLLAGFLFSPRPEGWLAWAPALLYTIARIADYLDGYVARATNHETKLGAILDIELDGLGILIVIALGIQYGVLPLWYLPLGLARQLFIAGIWWRERQGLPVYDLTPSGNRRIVAGYQTGFLSVALWPIWTAELVQFASIIFAIPLFASFARDWLVVSGILDPTSPRYLQQRQQAKSLLEGWLPLAARLGGTMLATYLLWRDYFITATWLPYLQQQGLPSPSLWLALFTLLFLVALPPFLLGVLGRVVAIFIIGLAVLDILAQGLSWTTNSWLLLFAIIVAHSGSGYFALWKADERVVHTHYGKPTKATRR